MPPKRPHEDAAQLVSPFTPMFEEFRAELDEHHDRRERVVKASRDITAASKKIIFSLQRCRNVPNPTLPPFVTRANQPHWDVIRTSFSIISPDIQGQNFHRYKNISWGIQEFIEAISFQKYLETQQLLSYQEAKNQLKKLGGEGGPVELTVEDYLLGLYDLTGEMMRFGITGIAMDGKLPGDHSGQGAKEEGDMEIDSAEAENPSGRNILTDLRELRVWMETFDIPTYTSFGRDVTKKMEVMQQSVEKVEKAFYSQIVRGKERPQGWMPNLDAPRREEVESF